VALQGPWGQALGLRRPLRSPSGGGLRARRRPGACPTFTEHGSALLAVLWLSVALSAIAFSVANTVRGETERTSTATESLRAYYLASGSIDRAVLWVYWGMYGGYLNPDGSPRYYRPPMPYIHYSYEPGDVVVEVIPEAGKLNVNTAQEADIGRLLFAIGVDADRARQVGQGIIAYRTFSEQTSAPSSGDGSTFSARHASLEELEELLLVPGMTPDIFYGRFDRDPSGRLIPRGGLRDCLTVWGAGSTIDVNTAPPALLESLGVPEAAVQQIVARRFAAPFKNMDEVRPFLAGMPPETVGRLGIGGATIWTLRATARLRLPGGKLSDVRRTVSAAVKFLDPGKFDPPYHILRWYDDAWSPAVIPF
jgi:general secretion pathway protein K